MHLSTACRSRLWDRTEAKNAPSGEGVGKFYKVSHPGHGGCIADHCLERSGNFQTTVGRSAAASCRARRCGSQPLLRPRLSRASSGAGWNSERPRLGWGRSVTCHLRALTTGRSQSSRASSGAGWNSERPRLGWGRSVTCHLRALTTGRSQSSRASGGAGWNSERPRLGWGRSVTCHLRALTTGRSQSSRASGGAGWNSERPRLGWGRSVTCHLRALTTGRSRSSPGSGGAGLNKSIRASNEFAFRAAPP